VGVGRSWSQFSKNECGWVVGLLVGWPRNLYAVTAYQAGTSLNLRLSLRAPGTLRHSYLPRLKNTAIYHTAAAGRSKWPLWPARSRRSARNGSSSPLGAAMALEMAAQ